MVRLHVENGARDVVAFVLDGLRYEDSTRADCDFVVCTRWPWGQNRMPRDPQALLDSYADSDKPVLIFAVIDRETPWRVPPTVTLFRTSALRSRLSRQERLLPFVWDPVARPVEPLALAPAREGAGEGAGEGGARPRPRVGFCGSPDSHPTRRALLEALAACPDLDCAFLFRTTWWQKGMMYNAGLVDEFERNMAETHFNVCARGGGNFSMRLYQTLSGGRIPVLLESDMVMPYADRIDWPSIAIVRRTPAEVIEAILEWSRERDLVAVQRECKRVYDTFFRRAAWQDALVSELEAALAARAPGAIPRLAPEPGVPVVPTV